MADASADMNADTQTLSDAAPGDGASQADGLPPPEDTGPPAFVPRAGTPPETLGGDLRPANYFVPSTYTHDRAWPLVILLHGYSASGALQDAFLQLSARVDSREFLLITPDGTVDQDGNLFWNATDACCDFFGTGVDDVGYLTGLMDELSAWYNVDPDRISVMGHSNGGYMSYRLACEVGDRLSSMLSLAGAMYLDDEDCVAPARLSVVHAHGTLDDSVNYNGSTSGSQQYKSAGDSAAFWAARNGCEAGPTLTDTVELDELVEGDDTEILAWSGCQDETRVEIWKIVDGGHVPAFSNGIFAERALDVLLEARRVPGPAER